MNSLTKLSIPFALGLVAITAIASSASADEVVGQPGSYLGAGVSLNALATTPSALGANITGRLKFDNSPISLRSTVLFGNGGTSVTPTVSYDLPVSDRASVYLGAGGSFNLNNNNTLTGDRQSFVLQPGAEVSVSKQVVLYGNAIVPISGSTIGSAGTSVQGGVGFQF
ncbi:porin family protein [Tumidithrix elongata RA019]|uniref:Porin family protein n=1 Tax=Tumidithrix elongata BACA0141 TaxID=2716417 RepID=A0AAW9PR47_9CYAN|nr:porin family protein [Tumidithrix elongata RA019]